MEKKTVYKDFYYILGVKPDATGEEIQEAYHELYDKYGPHVTMAGQDPDMLLKTFKDVSEAYETLMDPAKRSEYDKNSQIHREKGDLRSLWTKVTGNIPLPKADSLKEKQPAAEMNLDIEVTLKEAYKGARKTVHIDEPKSCDGCAGLKPVNRLQCPSCRGLGYTTVERTEEIELPAGLYDKLEIRKPELGKFDMRAGKRGDLVLRIKVRQHPFLNLLGRDIACTIPVSVFEAVLGAEIEVPTATGKVIMKIQPLTQPGRVYRLKGLGLAGADQLVTVEIVLPQQLSAEEMELFRQLKKLSKEPCPRESLWEKL